MGGSKYLHQDVGAPSHQVMFTLLLHPKENDLAFGSTERGVGEILGGHAKRMQNAKTLNFFPGQHTQTVRLEEALLGCLAVLHSGA